MWGWSECLESGCFWHAGSFPWATQYPKVALWSHRGCRVKKQAHIQFLTFFTFFSVTSESPRDLGGLENRRWKKTSPHLAAGKTERRDKVTLWRHLSWKPDPNSTFQWIFSPSHHSASGSQLYPFNRDMFYSFVSLKWAIAWHTWKGPTLRHSPFFKCPWPRSLLLCLMSKH